MTFFRLPLRMGEAGEGYDTVLDQGCMPDEDHVGEVLLAMDETDIGDSLQLAVQLSPLRIGKISRGPVQISCHPRIDDVINVIPLRWTHQVGWAIEVRERSKGPDG
jgi:hypothetical protein